MSNYHAYRIYQGLFAQLGARDIVWADEAHRAPWAELGKVRIPTSLVDPSISGKLPPMGPKGELIDEGMANGFDIAQAKLRSTLGASKLIIEGLQALVADKTTDPITREYADKRLSYLVYDDFSDYVATKRCAADQCTCNAPITAQELRALQVDPSAEIGEAVEGGEEGGEEASAARRKCFVEIRPYSGRTRAYDLVKRDASLVVAMSGTVTQKDGWAGSDIHWVYNNRWPLIDPTWVYDKNKPMVESLRAVLKVHKGQSGLVLFQSRSNMLDAGETRAPQRAPSDPARDSCGIRRSQTDARATGAEPRYRAVRVWGLGRP